MKQASRMWVQKYTRPRDSSGRFTPGYQLWTREDGQTRWIRFLEPDGELRDGTFLTHLNDDALRHVAALLFVIFVAALLALFVR